MAWQSEQRLGKPENEENWKCGWSETKDWWAKNYCYINTLKICKCYNFRGERRDTILFTQSILGFVAHLFWNVGEYYKRIVLAGIMHSSSPMFVHLAYAMEIIFFFCKMTASLTNKKRAIKPEKSAFSPTISMI